MGCARLEVRRCATCLFPFYYKSIKLVFNGFVQGGLFIFHEVSVSKDHLPLKLRQAIQPHTMIKNYASQK